MNRSTATRGLEADHRRRTGRSPSAATTAPRPSLRRLSYGAVILVMALFPLSPGTARPDTSREPHPYGASRPNAENIKLIANVRGTGGDIAFWDDIAVVGTGAEDADRLNDGFMLMDISQPSQPNYLGEFRCSSSYDDLSVWRDLVFLTVNRTLQGTECDESGGDGPFSGLRIVSIADPRHPVQIAAVNQDCMTAGVPGGTQIKDWINHTTYPDLKHRAGSGRPAPRLIVVTAGGCGGELVEVPLRDPTKSRVVGKVDTGAVLACHDLSVLVPRKLAAVACFTETQIWDLSDLEHPQVVGRIVTPEISGHHGTGFSWDGNTLVIADERGGFQARATRESGSTCPVISDAPVFGHLWFYDITVPTSPKPRGHFELEGPEKDICSPHAFNIVPLRGGRDVVVTGWYAMGTRVIDFTDPSQPEEVAHWAVLDGPARNRSQAWASYWYNGLVYSNNFMHESDEGIIDRGFDILSVDYEPLKRAIQLDHLNPQTYEFLLKK